MSESKDSTKNCSEQAWNIFKEKLFRKNVEWTHFILRIGVFRFLPLPENIPLWLNGCNEYVSEGLQTEVVKNKFNHMGEFSFESLKKNFIYNFESIHHSTAFQLRCIGPFCMIDTHFDDLEVLFIYFKYVLHYWIELHCISWPRKARNPISSLSFICCSRIPTTTWLTFTNSMSNLVIELCRRVTESEYPLDQGNSVLCSSLSFLLSFAAREFLPPRGS